MGRKSKLQPGDVVNRTYETVRLLGIGYSGEVWEVRHRFLGASFALKLIHEEDRDDEHKTSRAGAEAATLFRLEHQNVVRVFEANWTDDGLPFTVMELLRGETLAALLRRGPLHPLRAFKYAYDIACGLDAAHEIGVVHRDVKPENIFITTEGVAKLLDFTSAKFFNLLELRTTRPADRVGTLAFMSPEHIQGTTSDARLDQYSLAFVLWCTLVGRHPFEHHMTAQYQLIKDHFEEHPEPLAEVAGLPAWIDDVLTPALHKLYEQRYPTMADFGRAIHEGMRRLVVEMSAGRLVVAMPLGEPPIDLDPEIAAPPSRRVYVAPEEPAHQTTGPVHPSRRVTVAPTALPQESAAFDAAVTTPLVPSTRPQASTLAVTAPMARSVTTAPVQPLMTTAPVQRPPRARTWFAPPALVLALALPIAGGVLWRWRTLPQAAGVAASATTPAAEAPTYPEPSTTAIAEPSASSSAASSSAEPRVAPAPVETAATRASAPPPARRPPPPPSARKQVAVPPTATPQPSAAPAATLSAAPPPSSAPPEAKNRLFGTEN